MIRKAGKGSKKPNLAFSKKTEAKRNVTHSDLSVEMKNLEQIKGFERYLNIDRTHD